MLRGLWMFLGLFGIACNVWLPGSQRAKPSVAKGEWDYDHGGDIVLLWE